MVQAPSAYEVPPAIVSPVDHNEITVTNIHEELVVAPLRVVVAAVAVVPVPVYDESHALPVA